MVILGLLVVVLFIAQPATRARWARLSEVVQVTDIRVRRLIAIVFIVVVVAGYLFVSAPGYSRPMFTP